MRRCRSCCLPDTKPDLHFDETGQCSACRAYERRPAIDWASRRNQLLSLLERHDGRCLVPSSGGKDSTYQVLTLLELGAKPIIVTATTCHLTDIGRRNIDNLGRYAETIEVTPNRDQRAKLNRLGLEMVGDISWPEHVAIFTVPFQVACRWNIPLLFYGENPQDQYGGPPGSEDAMMMTRRWVSEYGGFLGLRPADMVPMAGDMSAYEPPPTHEIERVGVEAHFLGQYIPWDSHQNVKTAIRAGFYSTLPTMANWWAGENLDNAQTGIHDHLCFRKYGYGRGAAQVSVDIRAGKTTREMGLAWVRRHDHLFPSRYMGVPYEAILERIGMTKEVFHKTLDDFTDWSLMRRVEDRFDATPVPLEC